MPNRAVTDRTTTSSPAADAAAGGTKPELLPEVRAVSEADAAAWDQFVDGSTNASLYHRYAWRTLLQDVFKLETHYLGAFRDSELTGVLPLVRQKSRIFGDYLVSMPYFNYGGLVGADAVSVQALLRAAHDTGKRLGVEHVELRHVGEPVLDLPARTDKVSMLLDLPDSPESLRAGLKAKVRAQIKRPEREGISCVEGGEELLPRFYGVFARNMRDLGTPVYPMRFFQQVLRRFPDQARVFVAELSGKNVAAGLVLGHRGVLEIPWASSLREANRLGVNMYLYWRVLSWAIHAGYHSFDFGRCSVDAGTYRFKRQWGSRPVQLNWHYLLYGNREVPQLNHSNPKYQALIGLWKRQPVFLANAVSPLLARHLP